RRQMQSVGGGHDHHVADDVDGHDIQRALGVVRHPRYGTGAESERARRRALEGVRPAGNAVLPDARDDRRTENERRKIAALALDQLLGDVFGEAVGVEVLGR
ncbi:hypothetical protein PENTCL1PPCAC_14600, partial [Pristionchus entomophagus]